MDILKNIIGEIKSLYCVHIFLIVIAIGIFTILIDYKRFKKQGLHKDAKSAKIIGLIYLIGGPILYILLRIF